MRRGWKFSTLATKTVAGVPMGRCQQGAFEKRLHSEGVMCYLWFDESYHEGKIKPSMSKQQRDDVSMFSMPKDAEREPMNPVSFRRSMPIEASIPPWLMNARSPSLQQRLASRMERVGTNQTNMLPFVAPEPPCNRQTYCKCKQCRVLPV